MLKALGHSPSSRKDLTRQELQDIDYMYYPFLTRILESPEECAELQRRWSIHEPVLMYLCNKYLDRDKIRYDTYIHLVEQIDNEETEESVEKIMDPLGWDNFVELLSLYASHAYHQDSQLSYSVCDLFWRLCESKNVELESAIKIL